MPFRHAILIKAFFEIADTDADMENFQIADTDTDIEIFQIAVTDADTDMIFSKNRGHGHDADRPRTRVSTDLWLGIQSPNLQTAKKFPRVLKVIQDLN